MTNQLPESESTTILSKEDLASITGGGWFSDTVNGAGFLTVGIIGETLKTVGATETGQGLVDYAYNTFGPKP